MYCIIPQGTWQPGWAAENWLTKVPPFLSNQALQPRPEVSFRNKMYPFTPLWASTRTDWGDFPFHFSFFQVVSEAQEFSWKNRNNVVILHCFVVQSCNVPFVANGKQKLLYLFVFLFFFSFTNRLPKRVHWGKATWCSECCSSQIVFAGCIESSALVIRGHGEYMSSEACLVIFFRTFS